MLRTTKEKYTANQRRLLLPSDQDTALTILTLQPRRRLRNEVNQIIFWPYECLNHETCLIFIPHRFNKQLCISYGDSHSYPIHHIFSTVSRLHPFTGTLTLLPSPHVYRGELKGWYFLLSRTQAGQYRRSRKTNLATTYKPFSASL